MLTLTRTRPDSCLSDLTLDRLLASELDNDSHARAEAHLSGCERCRGRRDEFAAARRTFQTSGPARVMPTSIANTPDASSSNGTQAPMIPLRPRRRSLITWSAIGTAVAAAAATIMIVRTSTLDRGYTQRKGDDGQLGFYVKRADAIHEGASGTIVYPDDRLRFTYHLDEPSHMAVLSVDGAGVASIYYPGEATASAEAVPAGQAKPLPASTILDDTLGTETLYGLFCEQPVALEPIRSALEVAPTSKPWPAGCTVHTLTIEKRLP